MTYRSVKKLITNWHQVGSVTTNEGSGEDYSLFEIGSNGVLEIQEQHPHKSIPHLSYLIIMEDGTQQRAFNPDHVTYSN